MTTKRSSLTLRGFIAGVGATAAMSTFMLAARRRGWMSELPPTPITRATLEPLPGKPPRGRILGAMTALAHVGFGATAGVVYARILHQTRSRRQASLTRGVLFGTAIWVGAYMGVLPAIGLMPRPEHDERRRPASMLIAHWIFGATLALLLRSRG